MNRKQKNLLDSLISIAERQVMNGETTVAELGEYGLFALKDFAENFCSAMERYYSYPYLNDAYWGGTKGGYSKRIIEAINEPFKAEFKEYDK